MGRARFRRFRSGGGGGAIATFVLGGALIALTQASTTPDFYIGAHLSPEDHQAMYDFMVQLEPEEYENVVLVTEDDRVISNREGLAEAWQLSEIDPLTGEATEIPTTGGSGGTSGGTGTTTTGTSGVTTGGSTTGSSSTGSSTGSTTGYTGGTSGITTGGTGLTGGGTTGGSTGTTTGTSGEDPCDWTPMEYSGISTAPGCGSDVPAHVAQPSAASNQRFDYWRGYKTGPFYRVSSIFGVSGISGRAHLPTRDNMVQGNASFKESAHVYLSLESYGVADQGNPLAFPPANWRGSTEAGFWYDWIVPSGCSSYVWKPFFRLSIPGQQTIIRQLEVRDQANVLQRLYLAPGCYCDVWMRSLNGYASMTFAWQPGSQVNPNINYGSIVKTTLGFKNGTAWNSSGAGIRGNCSQSIAQTITNVNSLSRACHMAWTAIKIKQPSMGSAFQMLTLAKIVQGTRNNGEDPYGPSIDPSYADAPAPNGDSIKVDTFTSDATDISIDLR